MDDSPCCSTETPPETPKIEGFSWKNAANWRASAYNTMWCLIGCSIGDFGTIFAFQTFAPEVSASQPMMVMGIAMLVGITTSIILETFILLKRGFAFSGALKTAFGMSLISMLAMEAAMNIADYHMLGGARIVLWIIPILLLIGFVAAWPYNYWRLEKHGRSCCGN